MTPHARNFDASIRSMYQAIVSDDEPVDETNYAFQAPFRHAGLGFRRTEIISPLAYFASVFQAAQYLKDIDPATTAALTDLGARLDDPDEEYDPLRDVRFRGGVPGRLIGAYEAARETFAGLEPELFPRNRLVLLQHIHEEALPPDKLQRALTREVEDLRHEEHTAGQEAGDKKRTISLSSSASVSVHTSHPVVSHAIPNKAMITTTKIRAGTLVLPDVTCECGRAQLSVAHVLSCKKLRGRFARHDVIVRLLHSMLKDAGLVAQTETFILPDSSKRMDIVIYMPDGRVIWVDVTVANTLAESYVKQKKPAHEIREQAKTTKYGKQAEERNYIFIPAAIETHGEMGAGMLELLKLIGQAALDSHPFALECLPSRWIGDYSYRIKKRIAMTLAFGNHLMIEEALMRSGSGPIRNARFCPAQRAEIVRKSYEKFWKETTFFRSELGL